MASRSLTLRRAVLLLLLALVIGIEFVKMAVNVDSGGKEELKTQFVTREGIYRLITLSEYSRPNRVGYTNMQGSTSVRVSFVTLPDPSGNGDRICFNIGRELYVFIYKGVKKAADLTKPVDKKMYKGTSPTCHDFNTITMTPDTVSLLVGFSTGQVQVIDPIKKEMNKLFNEDRLIDKTKVTCIRWVPGSPNLFLVSHASGQLYLYNEEMLCGTSQPHYQTFKQGDGYSIYTCKTKVNRNPMYRWVIGAEGCSINEFAFSPCGQHLAIVSQDGFLRVFHYDTMELVGAARSYFGGFLCVCWSPDGKYVVVGGEDDLVTVWSFYEKRVVARGQGHHSWVSVVAFDPFTTSLGHCVNDAGCGSDDEFSHECNKRISTSSECNRLDSPICYRLGSVGQDTQLCLWDITEDVLRQPMCPRTRTNVGSLSSQSAGNGSAGGSGFLTNCNKPQSNSIHNKDKENLLESNSHNSPPSFTQRLVGGLGSFGDRKETSANHKRNLSRNSTSNPTPHNTADDPMKLIGTSACPRFDECPLLEPLICKKIAHERLTALVFREDCFVAACQDGYVYTWARPGKLVSNNLMSNCLDTKDL